MSAAQKRVAGIPGGENADEALDRIKKSPTNWFHLLAEIYISRNQTQMGKISDWVEANTKGDAFFWADTHDGALFWADNSASTPVTILKKSPTKTAFLRSPLDYLSARVAAKFSAINWRRANIVPNPKFFTLAGATPENTLDYNNRTKLEAARVNYYFGGVGTETLREGWAGAGWMDTRIWLAWFVDAMRVSVFNHLKRTTSLGTRVGLTADGLAGIKAVLEGVCEQGVFNGGIEPNVVSQAMADDIRRATGNEDFDGRLTTGYLVYHAPIAQHPQTDRDKRVPPAFTVWAKGSGAVNFVDVAVKLEE